MGCHKCYVTSFVIMLCRPKMLVDSDDDDGMSRRCFEQMLDELELTNFVGYPRWYAAPSPVCYSIPEMHQDFRAAARLNRYDLYAVDYYRQPYWMAQNLLFPSFEPLCVIRRNDKRNFPSRNYQFVKEKRHHGEKRLYNNGHDDSNFKAERSKNSNYLSHLERRYQSGWNHDMSSQHYHISREERNNSRTSFGNSSIDLHEDVVDQHLKNLKQMYSNSRNPSLECLSNKENVMNNGVTEATVPSDVSVGSNYCESSGNEWKELTAQNSKSHLSNGLSFALASNYSNNYESWFCPQEQQQIVDMLKEVNVRHDRQLKRDMLMSKGEFLPSDESVSSNNDSHNNEFQQKSTSSDDEEDAIKILLSPGCIPPIPEAMSEEEKEIETIQPGYHDKSASEFFEEFQNIFTGSPEKKIINNLTKENMKKDIKFDDDYDGIMQVITNDDKDAVRTSLTFDDIDDIPDDGLENASSMDNHFSAKDILEDILEDKLPDSKRKDELCDTKIHTETLPNESCEYFKSVESSVITNEDRNMDNDSNLKGVQNVVTCRSSNIGESCDNCALVHYSSSNENQPINYNKSENTNSKSALQSIPNLTQCTHEIATNAILSDNIRDDKPRDELFVDGIFSKNMRENSLEMEKVSKLNNAPIEGSNMNKLFDAAVNNKCMDDRNIYESSKIDKRLSKSSRVSSITNYQSQSFRKAVGNNSFSEPILASSNETVYKRISVSEIFKSTIKPKESESFENEHINVAQLSPSAHLKYILGIGKETKIDSNTDLPRYSTSRNIRENSLYKNCDATNLTSGNREQKRVDKGFILNKDGDSPYNKDIHKMAPAETVSCTQNDFKTISKRSNNTPNISKIDDNVNIPNKTRISKPNEQLNTKELNWDGSKGETKLVKNKNVPKKNIYNSSFQHHESLLPSDSHVRISQEMNKNCSMGEQSQMTDIFCSNKNSAKETIKSVGSSVLNESLENSCTVNEDIKRKGYSRACTAKNLCVKEDTSTESYKTNSLLISHEINETLSSKHDLMANDCKISPDAESPKAKRKLKKKKRKAKNADKCLNQSLSCTSNPSEDSEISSKVKNKLEENCKSFHPSEYNNQTRNHQKDDLIFKSKEPFERKFNSASYENTKAMFLNANSARSTYTAVNEENVENSAYSNRKIKHQTRDKNFFGRKNYYYGLKDSQTNNSCRIFESRRREEKLECLFEENLNQVKEDENKTIRNEIADLKVNSTNRCKGKKNQYKTKNARATSSISLEKCTESCNSENLKEKIIKNEEKSFSRTFIKYSEQKTNSCDFNQDVLKKKSNKKEANLLKNESSTVELMNNNESEIRKKLDVKEKIRDLKPATLSYSCGSTYSQDMSKTHLNELERLMHRKMKCLLPGDKCKSDTSIQGDLNEHVKKRSILVENAKPDIARKDVSPTFFKKSMSLLYIDKQSNKDGKNTCNECPPKIALYDPEDNFTESFLKTKLHDTASVSGKVRNTKKFGEKSMKEKHKTEQSCAIKQPDNGIVFLIPVNNYDKYRNASENKFILMLTQPIQIQIYLLELAFQCRALKVSPDLQNNLHSSLATIVNMNLLYTLPIIFSAVSAMSSMKMICSKKNLKKYLNACGRSGVKLNKSKELQRSRKSLNVSDVLKCWDILSRYFVSRKIVER